MQSANTSSILSSTSAAPFIGRLLMAAIFLISGVGKLMAPGGTIGYIASVGIPLPELAYAGALAMELGGALLLVAGYRTRWVAAALALFSVVSAVIFHNALGDQNQLFHFLKNLAMAGGLLQVVAFGAGSFSLDERHAELPVALGAVR
ncbi:putative oxidoreductase [Variovorax beijingensis]|jgi:putative oxidoreductase|uniref:Oxidoreductase n=2 Tax=Variovorax TaxID=34072 RepID=A0AAE3Y468_VARPD|nr:MULTISPECIES: DoxX family protein [Variovorax]MBD9667205.1 DoxX family protein [Variovorax sp. VRV01]MDR6428876.1 putative oxidoreductase [Variovorax paradoxus]TWD77137.1 putative oxidoreductase [Variovorax beijingensis]